MSFKNKMADFLTLAAQGYDSMSSKEALCWYAAAIPANVAHFKLLKQGRYGATVALSTVMTSALLLRSFTLGLRLRKECPPAPMWEPKPNNGAANTRTSADDGWVYSTTEYRYVDEGND